MNNGPQHDLIATELDLALLFASFKVQTNWHVITGAPCCGLRANDLLFLDRAFPDALACCRVFGLNPNEFLSQCFHHRYASVFLLDRLPVQRKMTLGPEDYATAGFLDEWHARDYGALGYDVVRVPVLPPNERLVFVLERLAEQGLS